MITFFEKEKRMRQYKKSNKHIITELKNEKLQGNERIERNWAEI